MPVQVELQASTEPRTLTPVVSPYWWEGLLCGCAATIAILCTYPVAETGFIDDWSFIETALQYARTGHFVYNGWGAVMLGWQVPWAALFIKGFGYTFTAVRASMLPVDFASVSLCYSVLYRLGCSRSAARFGSLTLGLSPLFVPLGASFMTDVSGLFAIVLCLYLCLRALAAPTEAAALAWLWAAAVSNVIGGSARQIAWLGALVLVPCTAWLMRRTVRLLVTTAGMWIGSVVTILLCLRWLNRQPYSVPERIFQGPVNPAMLGHLAIQFVSALLCLALLVLPALFLWIPRLRHISAGMRTGMVAFCVIAIGASVLIPPLPRVIGLPWLGSVLGIELIYGAYDMVGTNPFVASRAGHVALSILVALLLCNLLTGPIISRRSTSATTHKALPWQLVLLGPFTVAYICLLLPRALYSVIYDRYLLGLLPIAIFALLKLYERESCRTIPRFAYIPLLAMATYAVIATHDLFALDRARVAAAQEVISSGIPAREVQAGFDFDGLTQIESSGYVNFPTIQVPTTAYKQDLRYLKRPAECRSEYDQYFSALNPKYRVAFPGSRCGEPTPFKPVQYRTWLSPTHRRLEIVRVATGGN